MTTLIHSVKCWYKLNHCKIVILTYWGLILVFDSHPSIHFLYPLNLSVGSRGGAGANPSGYRARGDVHPVQVTSPSQGHTETNNHTRLHSLLRTILETSINLTCMFLERTHTYTGRTCKLHTERPQLGVEPGTLLLWGNSANHHTTVQPVFDSQLI